MDSINGIKFSLKGNSTPEKRQYLRSILKQIFELNDYCIDEILNLKGDIIDIKKKYPKIIYCDNSIYIQLI